MGNKSSLPSALEKEQLLNHAMATTGHTQASIMQKMKVFFKYASDGKNLNDKDLKRWFKENASVGATNSLFSGSGSDSD